MNSFRLLSLEIMSGYCYGDVGILAEIHLKDSEDDVIAKPHIRATNRYACTVFTANELSPLKHSITATSTKIAVLRQ